MVDLNLNPPDGYFNEEVRRGYRVSPEMKRVWAVEIDLLKEFERVCDKFGLKYSLFGGSMLGAVREKGFIPWDDDIDVVMDRKDYDVLISHGDEFKSPYFLQTPLTDEDYFIDVVKLRNTATTGATWLDMYSRFNSGIFIDIFVIDGVPRNPFRRMVKYLRYKFLGGLIYGIFYGMQGVQCFFKRRFRILVPTKRMYRRFDRICSKECDFKALRAYVYYIQQAGNTFPLDCMDDMVTMPFEYVDVKVCGCFDEFLRKQYGSDYMTPKCIPTMHGKTYFDTSIPFDEYFEANFSRKARKKPHR